MITTQQVRQARRMIENQHLAQAAADAAPRQSGRRNHFTLLALYSNLVANELVSGHSSEMSSKLDTPKTSRVKITTYSNAETQAGVQQGVQRCAKQGVQQGVTYRLSVPDGRYILPIEQHICDDDCLVEFGILVRCPKCDAAILEDQPGFCEACMENV
jgi:hypothetical protein